MTPFVTNVIVSNTRFVTASHPLHRQPVGNEEVGRIGLAFSAAFARESTFHASSPENGRVKVSLTQFSE